MNSHHQFAESLYILHKSVRVCVRSTCWTTKLARSQPQIIIIFNDLIRQCVKWCSFNFLFSLFGNCLNMMHNSFHCASFALQYVILLFALIAFHFSNRKKWHRTFLWAHWTKRSKKLMYNLWENQLILLFCIRIRRVWEKEIAKVSEHSNAIIKIRGQNKSTNGRRPYGLIVLVMLPKYLWPIYFGGIVDVNSFLTLAILL